MGNYEAYLSDAKRARAQVGLTDAWKPFHASFNNDAPQVAQSIYDGCVRYILYLSPMNLNGAVDVLKAIGFEDKARDLLQTYMEQRAGENIFDLSEHPFGSEVTDLDVIAAFKERAKLVEGVLPSPLEAASRISKGGWSGKDEEALEKLSVDRLVELFKATEGADRAVIILSCLDFEKISNATPRQRAIAASARSALEKIARESPLNARRMKAYNINIEAEKAS